MASDQSLTGTQQAHVGAWTLAGEPNAHHQKLAQLKGDWKFTTQWRATAQEKAVESSGTSTFTVLYGGRYVEQRMEGTVLGKPYEGRGTLGYDNRKNRFVSSWIDNQQTSIITAEGTGNDDGIELSASHHIDPSTGDASGGRLVLKLGSSPTLEWFEVGSDGKEYCASKTTYSRA
jgi:hypothetical protein